MNKKGISPLIGTVLLVAIVIAMVLLIMPWVTNMIEKQKQRTTEASRQFDCITRLNFNLIESDGNIMVDNKGDIAIEELKFRTFEEGEDVDITGYGEDDDSKIIEPYDIVDVGVTCGTADRIEVIATIRSEGRDIVCADASRDYFC